MNKPYGWDNTKAVEGNYETLTAGGYVARIVQVTDVSDKQYLLIRYDIDEGTHKDEFANRSERFGKWPRTGIIYRSYKETALGMFKWFIEKVEESNPGYKYNFDENTLAGKRFGVVLRQKEYLSNGEVKTALEADKITTAAKIRAGDFKVLDVKRVNISHSGGSASNNANGTRSSNVGFFDRHSVSKETRVDLDNDNFDISEDDIQF